ncbi:hypothetical protein QMN03_18290, partial [Leptospira santarosai]|uniref:hypothetical protein n=1 Tax=Leptospira santarosai TaxID=28183 RepID=UPI0024AFE131
LTYFKDDTLAKDSKLIRIKKLSFVKQEELIRNWKSIGRTEISDTEIDILEEKINTIISQNQIVPRYPFYILSILQSLEAFMPNDYKITAYGHCYQALITAQLLKKNIKSDEIDSCFNYLSNLAFNYFNNGSNSFKEDEHFKSFNIEYKSNYIINESILNKLKNSEYPILRIKENSVRFEHPYLYYFFLGKYLAEKSEQTIISDLCKNIFLKENSYIIIFTVHHAQTQSIIDEVILHSLTTFDKIEPAKLLKTETDFMGNLITELPIKILSDKTTEENRKIERNYKEMTKEPEEDTFKGNPILEELHKALKLMEVLGQIAKNRAGSFPKPKIKEIIIETQELGLRVLNFLLDDMKSDDFRNWLTQKLELKNNEDKLNQTSKIQFIEKTIRFFAFVITASLIDKIADCIGSEKLLEIVNEIKSENQYPAYELINMKVKIKHNDINIKNLKKIKSDFQSNNNKWAIQAMSYNIQSYMNTHKIDQNLRQQLIQLLQLGSK